MTLELGVYLHVGHAVATVGGKLNVTNSAGATSAIAALAAQHQAMIVELSVPGYADG